MVSSVLNAILFRALRRGALCAAEKWEEQNAKKTTLCHPRENDDVVNQKEKNSHGRKYVVRPMFLFLKRCPARPAAAQAAPVCRGTVAGTGATSL